MQGHETIIHAPVITGSGGEARFWFAGKLICDVIVVVAQFTVVLFSETDADCEF